MLYALGFIGLFTIGGLTGLFLAALGLDVHVHDTYFVVAHFHYIMVGGAIMGYLGGLHYWWPKISGRMYPEGWGRVAAIIIFVGFNLTFFPQFILGYLGMPRRYHYYPRGVPDPPRDVLGRRLHPRPSATCCRSSTSRGRMRYGRRASANPWDARGPGVGDRRRRLRPRTSPRSRW